eukprot:SAG31_NODE_2138_length_6353_cov_16.639111_2_plen_45_part_00
MENAIKHSLAFITTRLQDLHRDYERILHQVVEYLGMINMTLPVV